MSFVAALRLFACITLLTISSAASFTAEINTRPLDLKIEPVFTDVQWPGWESIEETGVDKPLRIILVGNAGDGSGRIFAPSQQGVIYSLAGRDAKQAEVFLDIQDKVSYSDKTNEEGFLGLAFHPKFKDNGEFFVYYTNKKTPHQNVISRFHVSKDDPKKADPASEEILLVFDKPFWNHDGGTLAFGPDGYLYVAVGDGGLANDPFGNGQNLSKLLGKILRIDVDRKSGDLPYAIPEDNPFVGKQGARPEIWAYGLRNVWRMAFDPKTGSLWAGDVGQDAWEEIDLISKGGNYGWNVREGLHPFVKKGAPAVPHSPTPEGMTDPIFEYNHDVGKSITGGNVYRGKAIPELAGAYLYADYVSNKVWALWYDADTKQVIANREIPTPKPIPVMSFGEDEDGETYLTTYAANGQSIFKIKPAK
jgi:quinoprotein glucose dehydrogenase